MSLQSIPVLVAIRCRPLATKETREGCRTCVEFIKDEPQVVLGLNKAFTYDFTYSPDSTQSQIYAQSIKPLVQNIFKGYNATILAYGQTGSGKTYTMGTVFTEADGFEEDYDDHLGIIPRTITDLFCEIADRKETEFFVKVSFLEIYNEDIIDLLHPSGRRDEVVIREDYNGGVKVTGLYEIPVTGCREALKCLERGSMSRTTAATAMNAQSSRSHAIFTVSIESRDKEGTTTLSKFHFVDLAGSERAKKTRAQGDRFKEGVNINLGLLALGNVISALSEGGTRSHVPYREAKLTRLLQDSLGGNSHTVMIACISPADSNMEETLNTLRYAHRARKIKNKPIVNRDPQAAEVARLKQMIQQLQFQLLNNQVVGGGDAENDSETVSSEAKDTIKLLQTKNQSLETEIDKLSRELQNAIDQTTGLYEKAFMAEIARDKMKQKLEELRQKTGMTIESFHQTLDASGLAHFKEHVDMFKGLEDKIVEIQSEHRDEETTIAKCELEQHGQTDEIVAMTNEQKTEITLRQAKMNRELQEINKMLALKEELAGRLTMSDDKINSIKHNYESTMRDLEAEVLTLQKEKEDLNRALHAAQVNTASSKMSEQRRKRLQELEAQIVELRKKIVDYSKMSKMKEQSDLQVKNLNREIQDLKQARVRLVRQMKKEAEHLRQWKLEKEKEVCQLKQQDRKRQCELIRKEQQFTKQQNVMRIKMEEAVSVNKRLKEVLTKQKQTGEQRKQERARLAIQKAKQTVNPDQVKQNVTEWISQEFDLVVSMREAKYHLQSLLDDRKLISEQLISLQQLAKEDGSSMDTDNSETTNEDDESSVYEKIQTLSNDLELRNIQIADLQQKLLDADQEEKGKTRFDTLQSMFEAKVALRWMFQTAVTNKLDVALKNREIQETKNNFQESMKTVDELQKNLQEIKSEYNEQIVEIQKTCEDKVLFLLNKIETRQSSNSKQSDEDDVKETLKLQEEQIKMLTSVKEELDMKNKENRTLRQKVAELQFLGPKSIIPKKAVKKKKLLKKSFAQTFENSDDDDDDDVAAACAMRDRLSNFTTKISYVESPVDGYESHSDKDPDWTHTPFMKRIQQMKSQQFGITNVNISSDSESDEPKPKKRSSEIPRCTCSKSNCSTKMCSCKKSGRNCSENCGCTPACQNKFAASLELTTA